jgi:carbon storage regulator
VLVFTRKRNQSVTIGDRIEIRVLSVGHDGVRLGVTAPPDVSVHRREVYDQIRSANVSAAAGASRVERLIEQLRHLAGRRGGQP